MELNLWLSPPSSPVLGNQLPHPLADVQLQAEQEDLQHQQNCMQNWNSLQEDIQQLHELFIEFDKVVHVSTKFWVIKFENKININNI